MAKKELFIHAIQQIEIDQEKNIPTAIYYQGEDQHLIGYDALSATDDLLNVNQDFKVDLGHHEAGGSKQRFPTATGELKSAVVLTEDFLRVVLRKVSRWLSIHQVEEAAHILIAEPLAMHNEKDWLENYRRNLRELLAKRTSKDYPNIRFEQVSFLPEPFAVFQYYRYGISHPLMASAAKHQALIIDFGGGTFDARVIATTREGDISRSGPNSKPFGASSVPVGGFYINRKIVERIYRRQPFAKSRRDQLKKGLERYEQWRNNQLDLDSLSSELKAFVLNFHRNSFEVEHSKLSLCKDIHDWHLDAQLTSATRVRIPEDPFSYPSKSISVPFSATELREVFISDIWDSQLRSAVKLCLERARADLNGQPITIVLLSGGSANIGWLKELLFNDFSSHLTGTDWLPLPDFQEVVSKGLAVECARRFYAEAGDFGSVIYNRLCLILDVNQTEMSSDCRPRPFRAITRDLPNVSDKPGVLLDSASSIQAFVDQPLRWKVQLGSSPKRLDYHFLRSSLNPDDVESRLNFEESTAFAPSRCNFDQDLKIELTVRDDGTATPRFIYHTGRTSAEEVSTQCRPFALDMTFKSAPRNVRAYIGFDFGTSNSSVSFVDTRSVKEYQRRLSDSGWRELSELAYDLPYPIADPLLNYLSQGANPMNLASAAREVLEAALAMLFFTAVADFRRFRAKSGHTSKSRVLGHLSQRSAGPLWGALRQLFVAQSFGRNSEFCSHIATLFAGEINEAINLLVDQLAQLKHEKVGADALDLHRPLFALANVCNSIFAKVQFGYFENVRKRKFGPGIDADFRIANGNPPFIDSKRVHLDSLVPEIMPYLLIGDKDMAVPLSPMVFWWQDPKTPAYDHGLCYLFDCAGRDGSFSFKTVGRRSEKRVSSDDIEFAELANHLREVLADDTSIDVVRATVIESE